MKLTTKSRYAVNALTELRALESFGPVSLSDLSENQNIELSYLEQIFRKLRIAGIVKSTRGRNGGYMYAKDPSVITIKDIMNAVEEDLDATNCNGSSNCNHGGNFCLSLLLLIRASVSFRAFLSTGDFSVVTCIKV